jgi:hypothetical protein
MAQNGARPPEREYGQELVRFRKRWFGKRKTSTKEANHVSDISNKQKLYRRAQARGIEGRSKMSRAQLENALW